MGNITLIKTLFISKCIHLLTSSEWSHTFCGLGDLIKLNYLQFAQTICKWGLKMIILYHIVKVVNLSWIKKLSKHQNSQWFRLFQANQIDIKKSLLFLDQWCSQFVRTVTNRFWQNVLMD